MEELYKEYIDFTTIDETTVCNCKDASKENRMDAIWYYLQSLKSPVDNNSQFERLFKVARIVLLSPYSNPEIESVVFCKQKQAQRL